MKTGTIAIIVLAVVALIGGAIGWQLNQPEQDLGLATSLFVNSAGDVFGSKTGTTTAGVDFRVTVSGGQSATSTYPVKLGGSYKQAIFTAKALKASSTANMHFSFLGTNDYGCATSTASTPIDSDYALDMPTPDDINWFDIGDHLLNKVHSTSLDVGTSTLVWNNPAVATGKTMILNDLNYECIALQVSGSSTNAWAQIKVK